MVRQEIRLAGTKRVVHVWLSRAVHSRIPARIVALQISQARSHRPEPMTCGQMAQQRIIQLGMSLAIPVNLRL